MPDQGRSSLPHGAPRIDPAGLTGIWVNTESSPRGVARVVIERRPEALGIWAVGAEDRTHEGWGWTDAEALYAASPSGHDAVAFTAAYRAQSPPVALHANVSKGLLIVSSFQTRPDSGKSDARFAREFFRRTNPEMLKPLREPGSPFTARPDPPSSFVSTFVGTWGNTNSTGSGIDSVSFAATEGGATMRVLGMDKSSVHDWATTSVEIYTEVGTASEPAKIKAHFDFELMDVLLHGWVKQGVLVLALFRRFKDQCAASSYFDREFFYRMDEPLKGVQ
jgi:hypothetical protein